MPQPEGQFTCKNQHTPNVTVHRYKGKLANYTYDVTTTKTRLKTRNKNCVVQAYRTESGRLGSLANAVAVQLQTIYRQQSKDAVFQDDQ